MKYTECQNWTESLQVGMAKRWGYVPKPDCDVETENSASVPDNQSDISTKS